MNNMDDWQMAKEVGRLAHKAKGIDSNVFTFTNRKSEQSNPTSVVKLYNRDGLALIREPEERKRILRQYYDDTLAAHKILEKDPNPLGQSIAIGNTEYPLLYEVVPQGDIILDKEDNGWKDPDQASFGQRFVEGFNLNDLTIDSHTLEEDEVDDKQKIFFRDRKLYSELREEVEQIFSYLSGLTGGPFVGDSSNIKPFVEDGHIRIVITDLGAILKQYVGHTPGSRRRKDA